MPLGAACKGICRATEGSYIPAQDILEEFCNRGYGRHGCSRFPAGADDALRFSVESNADPAALKIQFIYERNYAPSRHGSVQYPVDSLEGDAACAQLRMFAENYLYATRSL